MPPLGWCRTLGAVITQRLGQLEVFAEQRSDDSRRLWIFEHAINKPVFGQQFKRLVLRVLIHEVHHTMIDLIFDHTFERQIPLTTKFKHLLVVQRRFTVVGLSYRGLAMRGFQFVQPGTMSSGSSKSSFFTERRSAFPTNNHGFRLIFRG